MTSGAHTLLKIVVTEVNTPRFKKVVTIKNTIKNPIIKHKSRPDDDLRVSQVSA